MLEDEILTNMFEQTKLIKEYRELSDKCSTLVYRLREQIDEELQGFTSSIRKKRRNKID